MVVRRLAALLMVLAVMVLGSGDALGDAKGTDRPIEGTGSGSGTATVATVDGELEIRFTLDGTERLSQLGRTTAHWEGRCTDPPTCTAGTGAITRVAADGDTLTTVFTSVPTGENVVHQDETITGGTGRFAGASGALTTISRDVFQDPLTFTTTWTTEGTISYSEAPTVSTLVSGLEGSSGSTIGPDGALYVTEGAAGRISRVDPGTGNVTTFASGLPRSLIGIGGAIDVAFIRNTAYVLVTVVGPDVGGSDIVGIYRVDDADSFTVVADIGAFALANPPSTQFDIPTGLQYALQPFRRGFLVTDGHHNRVLRVTLDGEVIELVTFGNTVPTGLEKWRNTVYMGEAGPIPHAPEDGRVVSFQKERSPAITQVGSGASLVVDVEFGRGRQLYALAQGDWPPGNEPGSPALPNTGELVEVNEDGTFTVVVDGLNLPTSVEFIGDTAYVVTLTGELLKIDNVSGR
jgi:hypothetical protein